MGIASLIDDNCDMANTSRKMTKEEIDRAKEKRKATPAEHVVGYDAAIYVQKNNPLDLISLEELADIYGYGGTITKWPQLGVEYLPATNRSYGLTVKAARARMPIFRGDIGEKTRL